MAKFLTLTDKCNLRCAFCYEIPVDGRPHVMEADPEGFAPELYSAMHDEGWREVVITGGEPTLMPTFFRAVRESAAQGYEKVIVASNGRRFSYLEFARHAKAAGLTHANISFFGPTRHVHDGITKVRGSFDETVRGIRNLLEVGVDVQCSFVVSKRNHRHLASYFDFVTGLGVRRFLVMGLKPFGGAFVDRERVFYDFEEGAPFVNAALRYGVEKGLDITTMGLPSPPFDVAGTKDDNTRALKYFDYVLKSMGPKRPYCYGHLCDRCFGRDVCPYGAAPGRLVVCKCVGVREGTLRAAIRAGATTVRALRDATNACTDCKTCGPDLKELIRCETAGLPYDPLVLGPPAPGRHGASDSEGLHMDASTGPQHGQAMGADAGGAP